MKNGYKTLANVAALTGATLMLWGCPGQKQAEKTPTAVTLDAKQAKAYRACMFDALTKESTAPVTTTYSDKPAITTTILVSGKQVATITLASDGHSAALNGTIDPKGPLKPETAEAARKGAPGCVDTAKLG